MAVSRVSPIVFQITEHLSIGLCLTVYIAASRQHQIQGLLLLGFFVLLRFLPCRYIPSSCAAVLLLVLGVLMLPERPAGVLCQFPGEQGLLVTARLEDDPAPSDHHRQRCRVSVLGVSIYQRGISLSGDFGQAALILPDELELFWGDTVLCRVNGCSEDSRSLYGDAPLVQPSSKLFFRLRRDAVSLIRLRLGELAPDQRDLANRLLSGTGLESRSAAAESFQRCGCMHILALSGMHIYLIVLILRRLLEMMHLQRASGLITSVCIVFFLLIAGPKPSLLRAVLMHLIRMLLERCPALGMHGSPALIAACCVHLLLRPADASSIGFQLSYSAVLGLQLIHPGTRRHTRVKLLDSFLQAGVTSFYVILLTLPVQSSCFSVLYPAVALLSLPLSLGVMLYMILSFFLVCAYPLQLLSSVLVRSLDLLFSVLCSTAAAGRYIPAVNLPEIAEISLPVQLFLIVSVLSMFRCARIAYHGMRDRKHERAFSIRFSKRNTTVA